MKPHWGAQMTRNHSLWLAATFLVGLVFLAGPASAQQSEMEAIEAANQAFYDALSSRDSDAMAAVWAKKPYVVNIGPRSTEILVGYEDAVANYWPGTFDRFSEIDVKLTSTAHIHVDGNFASVIGTESAVLRPNDGGEARKFDLFVTNLFEKDGDHWLMISHHAQMIPK